MFENFNIFSTQKCSFQQIMSAKSREKMAKKHNSEHLISLLILAS